MTTPITCNVPAPIYRIVSISSNILQLEFTNPLDMIGADCPLEIQISFNTLVGGSRIDWKFLAFVTSRIQLVSIALPATYGTISVRYYNCCDALDPSVSPNPSPSVEPSPSPSGCLEPCRLLIAYSGTDGMGGVVSGEMGDCVNVTSGICIAVTGEWESAYCCPSPSPSVEPSPSPSVEPSPSPSVEPSPSPSVEPSPSPSVEPSPSPSVSPSPSPSVSPSPSPSVSPSPSPSVSPSPSPSVSPSPNAPGCNSANYDVDGIPELRVLYNVGTSGGPSAYGTYDQSGNGAEWSSSDVVGATTIVRRGGSWAVNYSGISQYHRADQAPNLVVEIVGFRLARSQSSSDSLPVGDFVNTNDTRVSQDGQYYGSVDHLYYIGKYEITNAQYCTFLTAVGNLPYGVGTVRDDIFSLYNAFDSGGTVANNGISRSGASGAYIYTPKSNYSNRPVTFVSWLNCARYVNWLNNGQGTGDTETGVYSLNGIAVPTIVPNKAPGAIFWIPTENEWYKAAYYKGGSTTAGYWRYSTQSDNTPTEVVAMLTNGDGVVPEDCVGTPHPSPSVSPSPSPSVSPSPSPSVSPSPSPSVSPSPSPSVSPSPSPSVSPSPSPSVSPSPSPGPCVITPCDSDVPCPSDPPSCLDVLLSFTDVYKEPLDILNTAPLNPIWVPKEFKITVSQTNCEATARIESNPCRIPDRGNNCISNFYPIIDIRDLPIIAYSACYSCSRPIDIDAPCATVGYVPEPPDGSAPRNTDRTPRFYAPDYTIFKLLWQKQTLSTPTHPSIDCRVYGHANVPVGTWILIHTTSTDSEMRRWVCEHFRFHCMIDGIPRAGWPYNDLYWTAWDEVSPTLEQNTVYINLIPC